MARSRRNTTHHRRRRHRGGEHPHPVRAVENTVDDIAHKLSLHRRKKTIAERVREEARLTKKQGKHVLQTITAVPKKIWEGLKHMVGRGGRRRKRTRHRRTKRRRHRRTKRHRRTHRRHKRRRHRRTHRRHKRRRHRRTHRRHKRRSRRHKCRRC